MDNLTRSEARQRRGLLSDIRYDVRLDVTGAGRDAGTFDCQAVVRFRCRVPGSASFIDLDAASIRSAVLNGTGLPADAFDGARLRLAVLREENELRVVAECRYERSGMGMHRFRDPVDGAVYLYTQFESFAAHRVYPCFDQPDLKAELSLAVLAPVGFLVLSNSPVTHRDPEGDAVAWIFAPTPRLSPYVTAMVAGPYHRVADRYRDVELGLYCRRSLQIYLDSDELFAITKQGLAFFEAAFDYPYPFAKYDQAFVPEFRFGAMENAGCVTFADSAFLYRSRVTEGRRENRAVVLLHEMAHMWFGDLVTMAWWDDLWLNESFATMLAYLAAVRATRFTNASVSFSGEKSWAYRQDQLPTTHPIVADIPDVESVESFFDGISYAKGAAVLRQLLAWVGEGVFFQALRRYFRRYAFANADLAGFLASLEEVAGGSLRSWAREWLETAGVNTLRVDYALEGDGSDSPRRPDDGRGPAESHYRLFSIHQEAPSDWPTLRTHRVGLGLYDRTATDGLRLRLRREVEVKGGQTVVMDLMGVATADLALPNDGDLAYAKIRLDPHSLATVTRHLGELRDDLARSLCWSAVWEAVRDAEMAARDFLRIALNNVDGETEINVVERLLARAQLAILVYGDPSNRHSALVDLAGASLAALRQTVPGSDRQLVWARAFVAAARDPEHLRIVRDLLDGTVSFPGLSVDTDLRWQMVRSLAAVGAIAEDVLQAEEARDPTDVGHRHAAAAFAAQPIPEAKARAWRTILEDRELPLATVRAIMAGFQRHDQDALLRPYSGDYFARLGDVWADRGPEFGLSFAEEMYPRPVVDDEVVRATGTWLAENEAAEPVRRLLLEGRDDVQRALRARARDRGPESHLPAGTGGAR